jgi:hypothetical protein
MGQAGSGHTSERVVKEVGVCFLRRALHLEFGSLFDAAAGVLPCRGMPEL